MEKEHNLKRIESIYQMLFEMAAGNFNFRIEPSGTDDELERLIVLINMVAEELRANVFHNGYINSHFTFQYLVQNTFILNQQFTIKSYNPDLANSFGYERMRFLIGSFHISYLTNHVMFGILLKG
jgi:hypothetical protein